MRCRDAAAGSLTDRRSVALSPVDGRHAPGNHRIPQNSCWTSTASSEQGSDPAAPRVHRRSMEDHRHKDGAPVSSPTQKLPAHDPWGIDQHDAARWARHRLALDDARQWARHGWTAEAAGRWATGFTETGGVSQVRGAAAARWQPSRRGGGEDADPRGHLLPTVVRYRVLLGPCERERWRRGGSSQPWGRTLPATSPHQSSARNYERVTNRFASVGRVPRMLAGGQGLAG